MATLFINLQPACDSEFGQHGFFNYVTVCNVAVCHIRDRFVSMEAEYWDCGGHAHLLFCVHHHQHLDIV